MSREWLAATGLLGVTHRDEKTKQVHVFVLSFNLSLIPLKEHYGSIYNLGIS